MRARSLSVELEDVEGVDRCELALAMLPIDARSERQARLTAVLVRRRAAGDFGSMVEALEGLADLLAGVDPDRAQEFLAHATQMRSRHGIVAAPTTRASLDELRSIIAAGKANS